MSPTNYVPNGVQQSTNLTFDDSQKWVIGQLSTGRFVLVRTPQASSPYEALSGDPATGAVTMMDLVTNTSFGLPQYPSGSLPSASVSGRLVFSPDDGNVRVSNGATWTILASFAGSGVTASGTLNVNQLITGAGGTTLMALGTLGSTTTVLHGNAGGAPTFSAVSLTADVTGTLPVANGGGLTSYTAGDLITATGATTLANLAKGTANQVLGMNAGATTQEYKTLASADSSVTITQTANNIDFKAASASVLNRVTADVTFTTTGVDNTMYSFSLPGGTLSTNKRVRLTVYFQVRGADADTASTSTWKVKYGATTLFTWSANHGDGGATGITSGRSYVEVELGGDNATNVQTAAWRSVWNTWSGAARVMVATAQQTQTATSAAEDSTAAKTILVTSNLNANPSGTASCTLTAAFLDSLG